MTFNLDQFGNGNDDDQYDADEKPLIEVVHRTIGGDDLYHYAKP